MLAETTINYLRNVMNLKRFFEPLNILNSTPVPWSEHCRSAIGGLLGGGLVAFLAKFIGDFVQINEWAMASLGASALLIFVLPSSPMAQPKAVIGGNIIAALVGISCAIFIQDPRIGVPVAIGVSIFAMLFFNCLHAPAAATALSAVLGHIISYRFALFPVLIDSVLLVLAGIIYNRATGKSYPHIPQAPSPQAISKNTGQDDSSEVNSVLAQYKEFFDINTDDLTNIIKQVELRAYEQKLKSITCSKIMSAPAITVQMATPLEEAWILLRKNHIKALPVVDKNSRVIGIITLEDFLQYAAVDFDQTFGQRIKGFMRQGLTRSSAKLIDTYPNAVGQVMRKPVRVISSNRNALDLVDIFEGHGHHHLPVIDQNQTLVGILTQSDFVRAIHSSLQST